MGVPVVTLAGPAIARHESTSHLISVGMPELVAFSGEESRPRALELAGDLHNLALVRAALPAFLGRSPVCDAVVGFGGHFCDVMRAVWKRYCAGP